MSAARSSRRQFLRRIGAAAGVAAGSGILAAAFHNRNLVPPGEQAKAIPSFAVPGTEGMLAVAEGTDHALAVQAALQALGGMPRFVRAGDRVLIKANCAFDRPPHFGATSSPAVTGEVVRQCIACGARVRVIDNPINDPEGCFVKSGIMDAVQTAGADVWLPSPSLFARVKVGSLRLPEWEALYHPLTWADKVIGIPTVKTHNLCDVSLTMKNWYGFLGGGRNRLHQAIDDVIADLTQFIRPTLVVLDGSRLLVANGPTGGSPSDVRPGHTIAAGTDQVALDSFGAELLGFAPRDIEYITKAAELGLGTIDRNGLQRFRTVRVAS